MNLFVVVALILILGLGRDYTVFLREGGATRRSPALAVTLSALTMLCSFGLLGLEPDPGAAYLRARDPGGHTRELRERAPVPATRRQTPA